MGSNLERGETFKMEYEFRRTDDGLYHWGIRGMKWGVRRYQNKDGSLTPAGKKRLDKLNAKRDKLAKKEAKMFGKKPNDESKIKDMNSMSDEELERLTQRARVEKAYMDAQSEHITSSIKLANARPQKVSKGKEFMDKYGSKILDKFLEVGVDAGKKFADNMIKQKFGDSAASAAEKARKAAEEAYITSKREYELRKLAADATKAEKENKDKSKKDKRHDDRMAELEEQRLEAMVKKAKADAEKAEEDARKAKTASP